MISSIFFVLLIVFFLVIIVFLSRKDNKLTLEETIERNQTKFSKFFVYQGQKQHYTDQGSGEVVILIHGLGDSFQNYNAFSDLLKDKYRVICLDLPAFGLSEVPNKKFENSEVIQFYRSFVATFIEINNIEDFHLFGNSLGGLVCWDFAVNNEKFSIKSLTLLASAGFEMKKVKKNVTAGILEHLPKFVLLKGAPLIFSKLAADTCIVNKSKITDAFLKAHSSMFNKTGTIDFFFDLIATDFEPEIKKLKDLKVPTLIVWGEKDKIIPFQHAGLFEKEIPKNTKVIYPNCGHYPQIELPQKVMEDWELFKKQI